jgi:hypothetical protein
MTSVLGSSRVGNRQAGRPRGNNLAGETAKTCEALKSQLVTLSLEIEVGILLC